MPAGLLEQISYAATDDGDMMSLITLVRKGVRYPAFEAIVNRGPFSLDEWSQYLHLSERTMQRYKKEKKTFEPLQSEKILKIVLLHRKGEEVFGDKESFHTWLGSRNVALGGMTPKELLDSDFGIEWLRDSLTRIEQGVLA